MSPPVSELSSEQTQRQRFIRVLAPCLIVGGLLVMGMAWIQAMQGVGSLWDAAGVGIVALLGGVVYVLNHRGQIRLAGLVAGGVLIATPTYYLLFEGPRTVALVLFPAGVVFMDFLLGGHSGLIVATIDFLLYLGIGLAYEFGLLQPTYTPSYFTDLFTMTVLCYGLALSAGFFTRQMRRALRQAAEREEALHAADERKTQLLAELQAREEEQQRLAETVRELGSPIIPLAPGVIALPLIGALDSQRVEQVKAALLRGTAQHRAAVAILDVTGVPTVDAAAANALLQATRGVALLGAEPVLTGIRAETAQTLVSLGLDLAGLTTLATLQEGLEYAIARGKSKT